ncbi:MAG: response regulator [Rhodospirillaceae bacterium]|nr:response regulator [Rhodospirillaceae bacterium]MBT5944096.1 response regulator [Rhodospirillaceae bacterium]MBT6405745.1 response regulator [Rhodospirillaceae bacterium]MBT6534644.1 response regulator [Rhodospirillaceae bacterium]MBT7361715.1 response regulator [Rhodospirillaceae bacterium]
MSLDIHSEPVPFAPHGDIRNAVLRRMNEGHRKRRLLAIDGEEKYLEFIQFVAEDLNFEVHALTHSSEFAAEYQDFDPDVLLIDIMMPECDGVEIARWLSGCDTPKKIIFMSGLRSDFSQFSRALTDPDGIHTIHSFRKPINLGPFRELLSS